MAKRLEWKVSFQRNNKFPLDFDSVFSSKTAAEEYVINSSSSAHIGQIIAVTGETGSVIYKVDKLGVASGLTELTADVYNKSEIDTMISNAGKVKDVKVNGTTVVGADGVATITLPTVDDALNGSSVNAVQNKVITNKFSDYYSKSEVDSKISSAVSNVELFEFVDSLPSSGKTNLIYVAPNTGATGETNTYVEYIYKTDGTWEKVGEFKADTDLSNFYTKGESDSKYQVKGNYLTGITVDDSLSSTSENPVQNKVVYAEFGKVRDEITSAVTGDVSAALGNYVKKTDLNTINGRSLTGESSTNIEVGTIRDVKVNNTSVVNGTTANIDLTGYVPSTDYNALLERVVALEKFMTGSTFITASNIANYAVTSIASTDTDIDVNGNKGDVTITLNGISNIAYNDATE